MRHSIIIFILLLTTSCSVKWAEDIANKGSGKECINDYDHAMRIYNRGVFFNKRSAELYWRRGNLHARNANHDLAVKDLTKSIEIDSTFNSGCAYWDRAISKEYLEDLSGALNDFNQAIEINPKAQNYFFFRGTLRYKLEDYRGALDDFNTAIELWDDYYLARYWRSFLLVELGDYHGALADYERLSFSESDKLDPDYSWQFFYRGLTKFETGDTIGACIDWKVAATHDDSDAIEFLNKYCK